MTWRETLLICGLFAGIANLHATDYYVSSSGSDANIGTGQNAPWKSISQVNATQLKPGDRVLLHGGETFNRGLMLNIAESGTATNPVTVSSYASGRATIMPENETGIEARDAGGIVIDNLNVVGPGRTGKKLDGILFTNDLDGNIKLNHIRISNVDVSRFGEDGILIQGTNKSKSGYRDVLITHCNSFDNQYFGVYVTGLWEPKSTLYANSNVRATYCHFYSNTGDPHYMKNHSGNGILLEDVDGGLIDHCVAHDNGALCDSPEGGACGIWAAIARKITIQYCESYNNRTGKATDGDGFDFDGGTSESVMQYNYSHGNDGPGFLLYTYDGSPQSFHDNVIRYNISENDGRKEKQAAVIVANDGPGVTNCDVYNNTIYLKQAPFPTKAIEVRSSSHCRFFNNIIQTKDGAALMSLGTGQKGLVFQGNAYWSSGSDFSIIYGKTTYRSLAAWQKATGMEMSAGKSTALNVDPMLTSPGAGTTVENADQLSTLTAYRLKAGSPMIHSGLNLKSLYGIDVGQTDFYGNALHSITVFNRGAED